jgi:hypothetical protein
VEDTDGGAPDAAVGDAGVDTLAAGAFAAVAAVEVSLDEEQPASADATSTTTSGARRDLAAAATRRG